VFYLRRWDNHLGIRGDHVKPIEYLLQKSKFFNRAFVISFIIILIGFIVLSFPEIEQFFGQNQWLFYVLFFGPLGMVIIIYIIEVIKVLCIQYHSLRSSGESVFVALWHVLKTLVMIISVLLSYLMRHFEWGK
jgi:hypothetical protein